MPFRLDEHSPSQSFELDIARGHFTNAIPVHIFGFNRSIGLAFETIENNGGGIYVYPSSAVQMSLVSSDAADTMSVQISGLDTNYLPLVETIALTGVTPVVTTGSFLRINSATITTGNNVGNITISNGGTTYAYIEAGLGVTQGAIYTVPAGAVLYINKVSFSSGTVNGNQYLTGRANMVTAAGAELNIWESTWNIGHIPFDVQVPFAVPEKTDFSFQAKSSANTNEIGVYVNAHLITDE